MKAGIYLEKYEIKGRIYETNCCRLHYRRQEFLELLGCFALRQM